MKLYNKLSAIAMMCLMIVTSIAFTACDNDDLDTNQYHGGISLSAFGPSPVARGGELRFLGSGLDQINSIVLPGSGEITDIRVISANEIRITVPQDAEPGYVVLKHSKGEIKTLTQLTFLEPISLDKVSPLSVRPGDVLTITGDYLNLIKEVCFPFLTDSVNVYANDFVEHTRSTIKVVVPAEAISGLLSISDAGSIPNMIYADDEITVTLPAVDAVVALDNMKPGDLVTVTGRDFDLVTDVELPNGDPVEFKVESLTRTDTHKLTFTLPENVTDGSVVMKPASGVRIAIATLGIVVPTELVATPSTDLRGNDAISIKGLNMDQVVSVLFPNVDEAVTPESITPTEVKVGMPEKAHSGELILNLKSGKSVGGITISTAKPENVVFNPNPAPAGNEMTVSGKNLDLVTTIVYTGGTEVAISNPGTTEFKTKVPLTAQSGSITFKLANGETVDAGKLEVQLPSIAYISVMLGDDEEIKAGEILKVTIANENLLTNVLVNGETVQFIRQKATLYINIPETAGGTTKITLVSGSESLDYEFDIIPATHVSVTIFDTVRDLGSWAGEGAGGAFRIYKDSFEGVPAGAIMTFHVSSYAYTQIQVNDANWGQIVMLQPSQDETEVTVELTADILNRILSTNDGWSNTALVIQGEGTVVSKVTLDWENPTAVTVWEGEYELAWGPQLYLESSLFESAKAGAVLTFYVDEGAGFQIQLNDASWASFTTVAEWSNPVTSLSYTLTASDLNNIRTVSGWYNDLPFTGLIIQGSGNTLRKITYENQ